jgi:NAD(P)-dependent dehydrogenase (short-subunit alcohol dehydrogenase family)
MNKNKVWYVTGASQGFGLALVKQLLAAGYRVAATSRSTSDLQAAAGVDDRSRFLPLKVDLTSADSIRQSIEETVAAFGAIDVVVNNAGYGMTGTVEELDEKKMRDIFDINVFATINVTKYALPWLRKQRSGHFINIASVAGFVGAPGWSVYSATKSAVIAFSEVLALDVHELGIKVTVVGPSGFRTGFLTKGSLVSTESQIADYQSIAKTQARYAAMNGQQEGDPEKAAAVLIQLGENPEPPLHLWLGSNAVERAGEKIDSMGQELKKWKDLSVSADFK